MKLSAELKAFQARLGYEFQTPKLLSEAVTHASMSTPNRDDNQRLEFLGDAVLQMTLTLHLYQSYPKHHQQQYHLKLK